MKQTASKNTKKELMLLHIAHFRDEPITPTNKPEIRTLQDCGQRESVEALATSLYVIRSLLRPSDGDHEKAHRIVELFILITGVNTCGRSCRYHISTRECRYHISTREWWSPAYLQSRSLDIQSKNYGSFDRYTTRSAVKIFGMRVVVDRAEQYFDWKHSPPH